MSTTLLTWYQRFEKWPLGGFFFNKLLHRMIPYTGTVRPKVLSLEPGYAQVAMDDRRLVRNHLRSIHAVAQMNMAEFATGLAMTSILPKHGRAIITRLEMEYLKKARGRLVAECRCEPFEISDQRQTLILTGEVKDGDGQVVSRAFAHLLVAARS